MANDVGVNDLEFALEVLTQFDFEGRLLLLDALVHSIFGHDPSATARLALLYRQEVFSSGLQEKYERAANKYNRNKSLEGALKHRAEWNRRAEVGRNKDDSDAYESVGEDYSVTSEAVKKWAKKYRTVFDLYEEAIDQKITAKVLADQYGIPQKYDPRPGQEAFFRYLWLLEYSNKIQLSIANVMHEAGFSPESQVKAARLLIMPLLRQHLSWLRGPIVV